jgi:hypothetical protein
MYELNMPVVTNVQQEKDTCIEWSNMALNGKKNFSYTFL